jgi:hypothetical protein
LVLVAAFRVRAQTVCKVSTDLIHTLVPSMPLVVVPVVATPVQCMATTAALVVVALEETSTPLVVLVVPQEILEVLEVLARITLAVALEVAAVALVAQRVQPAAIPEAQAALGWLLTSRELPQPMRVVEVVALSLLVVLLVQAAVVLEPLVQRQGLAEAQTRVEGPEAAVKVHTTAAPAAAVWSCSAGRLRSNQL